MDSVGSFTALVLLLLLFAASSLHQFNAGVMQGCGTGPGAEPATSGKMVSAYYS